MNVTLKYMPQTEKTKECTGYMAMKLDIRKGSPADWADEAGCHNVQLSWAERLKLRRPNWPLARKFKLRLKLSGQEIKVGHKEGLERVSWGLLPPTCAQLVSEARNGRLNWADKWVSSDRLCADLKLILKLNSFWSATKVGCTHESAEVLCSFGLLCS